MDKKVIIIEDNIDLLNVLENALKSTFEVTCCQNAEEAYDHIVSGDYFAALVDINLPGMSGHEFISEIKSNEKIKSPYIIVMSAKNDFNTKLLSINLGAISFIEKPFDIRFVRGILSNLHNELSRDNSSQKFGDFKFENDEFYYFDNKIDLTRSEQKILLELLKNNGYETTRERLFQISGNHLDKVDYRVIDKHISSLRKKIKESDVTIDAIYGKGYVIKKVA